MPEAEIAAPVLSATTGSPPCLSGKKDKPKKLTRRQLVKRLRQKPEDLFVCQITAESYRPAMDSIKKVLEIHGSQAKPSLYVSLNKQVAAKAQMNGLNDPEATRRKRIAALTMLEDIAEVHERAIELKMDKEEMKAWRNERLTKTALFHGLGTKKDMRGAKA